MNILTEILNTKRKEVVKRASTLPLSSLKQLSESLEPTRRFVEALRNTAGFAVIAEVKKASPSKGVICENFDALEIALAYHRAGACALSVLTDEDYFQGKLEYLAQIRQAVPLPILRKDFIVSLYQVWESRAKGADALLLIVGALNEADFLMLLRESLAAGLNVLIEAHDVDELRQAIFAVQSLDKDCSSSIAFGINNRDLRSFQTDLANTAKILQGLTAAEREFLRLFVLVAESGINSRDDLQTLAEAGASAYLIGESLLRAKADPAQTLGALLEKRGNE